MGQANDIIVKMDQVMRGTSLWQTLQKHACLSSPMQYKHNTSQQVLFTPYCKYKQELSHQTQDDKMAT